MVPFCKRIHRMTLVHFLGFNCTANAAMDMALKEAHPIGSPYFPKENPQQ